MLKLTKKFQMFNQNKQHIIAITTGGTAGHIFPAYAVATILSIRNKILYFTDKRGKKFLDITSSDAEEKIQTSINPIILPVRNLCGGMFSKIIAIFYLIVSVIKAIFCLKKHNVSMVIGFGSFASFPALAAAYILRIPIIVHEQNAVLGRVNKIFLKYAKFIATSYHETLDIDDQYKKKVVFTGNPIKSSVFEVKRRRTRITKEIQILIIGGSQGAELFDAIIAEAIAELPNEIQKNITIFQQVRTNNIESVNKIYKYSKVNTYTLAEFFNNIPQIMIDSDFVISRGGASTISEISHIGIPSIIIPMMKAKDNHQYHNAKSLEKTGAAILLTEDVLTKDKFTQELTKILSNDVLDKMRVAANASGQNNAAQKLTIKINEHFMHT
jgi:UDP-N-acetylglucosamine--N-acetylmuramyl-(pentapeptide) pyrophosphoryl-undecaprenol N-acetylglucosamine transferase